jgi:hypothetical protein
MRTHTIDRGLLCTALAAALASAAWFGWQASAGGRRHRAAAAGAKPAPAAYVPASVIGPVGKTEPWAPPLAQARGPGWLYDVFTTPEICFDAPTGQFEVTLPDDPARANAPAAPSGVELIAVRRALFRLQLVGYVGREDAYLGTFENPLTTEIFLAGPGRRIPALDLEITDFDVRLRPGAVADGTTSNQRVATAIVRDTRTGRTTTLTAGERSYSDELRAVLADDDDEATRELRSGEAFQSSEHTYQIERLQLDPPLVELRQISSGSTQPVRLILGPRLASDPPPAPPAYGDSR